MYNAGIDDFSLETENNPYAITVNDTDFTWDFSLAQP